MEYAVQEAARYGMVHTTASAGTITAYAQGKLIGISANDPNLSISTTTSSTLVTVNATYVFNFFIKNLPVLVGGTSLNSVNLIAKAQMPRG
jgi:hypothetical protein